MEGMGDFYRARGGEKRKEAPLPWAIGVAMGLFLLSSGLLAEDQEPPVPKRTKYHHSRLTRDESESKADKRHVLVTTGEDRAVDIDFDVDREKGISIGNLQVVAVTLVKIGDQRQIVFRGLKSGETTVTFRDEYGTLRLIFKVTVTASNLYRRAAELHELLKDIEGIEIRVVGQKVVIDGEVLVPADYGRLVSVISEDVYKGFVLNLATMSMMSLQTLAKRIQDDINAFAPNVKTRVVNGLILLEGTVDNLDQANRAKEVAKIYLPEVRPTHQLVQKDSGNAQVISRSLIQNFIVINPPPPKKQEKLVRITVHFVELAKDYNKLFQFKWQPGLTSEVAITTGKNEAGAPAVSGTSFSGTVSSLIPTLKSLQTAGYARVLKTGTLITRSGQPAQLNEETNIPFVTVGPTGQPQVANTPVGLRVAATPLILGQSEDIQLDLDLSQVSLVGKPPVSGPPTTTNHNIKTKLYVKSNESAAVGGVVASDIGTDFNKDDPKPGSFEGNTQPLFTLMRTKGYRKNKSNFVIFVTPQIIENASEGTDDLKKNFRIKVK